MKSTSRSLDVAEQAWAAVSKACAEAGVDIIELRDLDQLSTAAGLYATVWSKSGAEPPIPTELLRAFAHAGNYVAGAFTNGGIVGALAGFLGQQNELLHLHSHILGVLPELQGRSAGYALKQHQRAWCLARGIESVIWTYDPLVARNAFFNLTKLGADAETYYPNFYGRMNDAINAGEESDRLLINWKLNSPKAVAASQHLRPSEPDIDELTSSSAVLLDADDRRGPVLYKSGAPVVLCRIPNDIVALRLEEPRLARAWRLALRQALGGALDKKYAVTTFTRAGWYVLSRAA